MRTTGTSPLNWHAVAAVARALGTAVASLALGAALCVGLLLGALAMVGN